MEPLTSFQLLFWGFRASSAQRFVFSIMICTYALNVCTQTRLGSVLSAGFLGFGLALAHSEQFLLKKIDVCLSQNMVPSCRNLHSKGDPIFEKRGDLSKIKDICESLRVCALQYSFARYLMDTGSLLGSMSGTILNYKRDTYVHCQGSLNRR